MDVHLLSASNERRWLFQFVSEIAWYRMVLSEGHGQAVTKPSGWRGGGDCRRLPIAG